MLSHMIKFDIGLPYIYLPEAEFTQFAEAFKQIHKSSQPDQINEVTCDTSIKRCFISQSCESITQPDISISLHIGSRIENDILDVTIPSEDLYISGE